MCVDLAFKLTKRMTGHYDRAILADEFRRRAIEFDLVEKIAHDALKILEFKT